MRALVWLPALLLALPVCAEEKRHGTRAKTKLGPAGGSGGGYLDFKRGMGSAPRGGYGAQQAAGGVSTTGPASPIVGGGTPISEVGARQGAAAAAASGSGPKAAAPAGGSAGGPVPVDRDVDDSDDDDTRARPGDGPPLRSGGLEVRPAEAAMELGATDPVHFRVSGIRRKEDTRVCYEVLDHPGAPGAASPSGHCAKKENFKRFPGNADWKWEDGGWTGEFAYSATQWGVAGIKVRSVFWDYASGKTGSARLQVVRRQPGGTRFEFPPFTRIRTDFERADEGTAARELELGLCSENPPDRQKPACCGMHPGAFERERCCRALANEREAESCIAAGPAARRYPSSNALNLDRRWQRYWVLHVNDEPAFAPSRRGPPGQSLPLGGAAKVIPLHDGFRLEALGAPEAKGNLFVGVGVETGRGAGPVPILPDARYALNFKTELEELGSRDGMRNSIHFFIETRPGGRRRFTWLFLGHRKTGDDLSMDWQWPVRASMWDGGATIDLRKVETYASECDAQPPGNPLPDADKRRLEYRIDLGELLRCVSKLSDSEPVYGIHWAVEQNSVPGNVTRIRVIDPHLERIRPQTGE